ncbi:hypothetical protein SXCC_02398 [Gluconacetobacter sp. SXCC-1]|nr:hypothetical protein SXCC_02398 [Gluconacetobacter sp. SXCC-1]
MPCPARPWAAVAACAPMGCLLNREGLGPDVPDSHQKQAPGLPRTALGHIPAPARVHAVSRPARQGGRMHGQASLLPGSRPGSIPRRSMPHPGAYPS